MKLSFKLLFSLIAATFIALGAMAIATETHTASTRRSGVVTLLGPDAVAVGWVSILLGLLPLFVWLPRKLVPPYLCAWFLAVMAAVFVPLFSR